MVAEANDAKRSHVSKVPAADVTGSHLLLGMLNLIHNAAKGVGDAMVKFKWVVDGLIALTSFIINSQRCKKIRERRYMWHGKLGEVIVDELEKLGEIKVNPEQRGTVAHGNLAILKIAAPLNWCFSEQRLVTTDASAITSIDEGSDDSGKKFAVKADRCEAHIRSIKCWECLRSMRTFARCPKESFHGVSGVHAIGV